MHIQLDLSLKMIEICQNSEQNSKWQIASGGLVSLNKNVTAIL